MAMRPMSDCPVALLTLTNLFVQKIVRGCKPVTIKNLKSYINPWLKWLEEQSEHSNLVITSRLLQEHLDH